MKIRKSHLLTPLLTLCFMPEAHSLSLLMQKYHNVEFAVVEVSEHDSLQLFWKNAATEQPYQSFSTLNKTLQKEKKQLLFAINSGIFGQDQSPLGWHMEKGELLKGLNQITRTNAIGNFSLIPNGVFFVNKDGSRHVLETENFLRNQKRYEPLYATQSGPMLVVNGQLHPKFFPSSDSLKYRSGVCVKNNTAYFAVTQSPINFYYFAKFFQAELGCKDALYLDGTLSQLSYLGKIYGAPFWNVRPYVGIWAVTSPMTKETSK